MYALPGTRVASFTVALSLPAGMVQRPSSFQPLLSKGWEPLVHLTMLQHALALYLLNTIQPA